jgi:lincosamide nucleotidyltransferase A/C/D/E
MMPAEDAAALCRQLEEHRIRFWAMGGWGVDALLHRETRPHKDLDVLVLLGDLHKLRHWLDEHGFTMNLVWQESRRLDEEADRWPTAFVVADSQGRELDVHLIDIGPDGHIIQHYDDPWPLPDSIAGQGRIAGTDVPCVSKATQLAMHTGYSLPDGHLRDLELLRAD